MNQQYIYIAFKKYIYKVALISHKINRKKKENVILVIRISKDFLFLLDF